MSTQPQQRSGVPETPRHARPAPSRTRRAVQTALVGATTLGTVAAMLAVTGASRADTVTAATNGGFERGLTGWVSSGKLSVAKVTHSGAKAVSLTAGADRKVDLRDRPNIVRDSAAGKYTATAWVKGVAGTSVTLRVREIDGRTKARPVVRTTKVKAKLADATWRKLTLTAKAGAHHELAVAVVGKTAKAGQSLIVDDVSVSTAADSAVVTESVKGTASTSGTAGTTTKAAASSSKGSTLFGTVAGAYKGETNSSALSRRDRVFSHPDIYRVFYPGAPVSWPGAAGAPNRPVVVSFKLSPSAVLSGKYDSQIRNWFNTAPKDRTIYWSYHHEPENDIARHQYTAAAYRQAWVHVAALAKGAPSNMKATLILMAYSVAKASHRNWRDYYPGKNIIDVLAWDAYNTASWKSSKNKIYADPSTIFKAAADVSKAEGKPFGFAEWGTLLTPGDKGAGRAAWIRKATAYLKSIGASFATYFDSVDGKDDYRLTDRASQQALADAINS